MGYSNNKWRKILTILMIVNLCFIIFSRITKSLGANYTVDETYIYDVYDSRCCAFILRFDKTASEQTKTSVSNAYLSGEFFPYLCVRDSLATNGNQNWLGLSDVPNLCTTYDMFTLFLQPYAGTTATQMGSGFMGFPDANIYSYQSTNSGFNVHTYVNGNTSDLNMWSNQGIVISANLYGYHSKYLDDYMIGLKYGNTSDVITALNNANDKLEEIKDSLTNTTPSSDSQNIVNDLQNTDNSTGADNINTSFFSNITSIFSDIGNYTLSDYNTVNFPIPFTNGSITIESNYLYSVVPRPLQVLISSFWYFIFGFYAFKFVNKIYISVKSGNILNGFSNSDEVITNNML